MNRTKHFTCSLTYLSQTQLEILRMSIPLLVGSHLLVTWWANEKEEMMTTVCCRILSHHVASSSYSELKKLCCCVVGEVNKKLKGIYNAWIF